MPTGGPFPTKNTEINDYFKIVQAYLNTHMVRLKISAADIATLNTTYTNVAPALNDKGWKELWALYANKALVNKTVRVVIRTRKAEMITILRTIYGDIPDSLLNSTDRNTLNLPLRDTIPTTIQAVDFAPVISFEKVSNGIQLLRFQNTQTPDSNAMPPKQKAELHFFVGAAGLGDNDIPFTKQVDTGKHLLQMNYAPEDKGKTAYYRARYKTNTGKVAATWSDVVSEIVL